MEEKRFCFPPSPLGGQLRVRVFSFSFLVSFGLLRWVFANFYPGGKERGKDMQGSSRGSKKGGKRAALLCNQVLFVATCSCFYRPLPRWHVQTLRKNVQVKKCFLFFECLGRSDNTLCLPLIVLFRAAWGVREREGEKTDRSVLATGERGHGGGGSRKDT